MGVDRDQIRPTRPKCLSAFCRRRQEAGAAASAALYSLIESAKADKVEPYAYLKPVFTEIPKSTSAA